MVILFLDGWDKQAASSFSSSPSPFEILDIDLEVRFQAWWQVPLPIKLSCQPLKYCFSKGGLHDSSDNVLVF